MSLSNIVSPKPIAGCKSNGISPVSGSLFLAASRSYPFDKNSTALRLYGDAVLIDRNDRADISVAIHARRIKDLQL